MHRMFRSWRTVSCTRFNPEKIRRKPARRARGGQGGRGRAAGAGRGGADAGRGNAGAAPAARPASLGTNAILYAFDADTGKELFRSELDSFNHFNNPVVAGGTVYAATWDGKLYAFGLKK